LVTQASSPVVVDAVPGMKALRSKKRFPATGDCGTSAESADLRAARAPVINGRFSIRNLGRAPLGLMHPRALGDQGQHNTLEYSRRRHPGGRAYLEYILAILCGAEAAAVVNNNAAALVLSSTTSSSGALEVVIRAASCSRSGGLPIPGLLGPRRPLAKWARPIRLALRLRPRHRRTRRSPEGIEATSS
jgi:hypothetical protein